MGASCNPDPESAKDRTLFRAMAGRLPRIFVANLVGVTGRRSGRGGPLQTPPREPVYYRREGSAPPALSKFVRVKRSRGCRKRWKPQPGIGPGDSSRSTGLWYWGPRACDRPSKLLDVPRDAGAGTSAWTWPTRPVFQKLLGDGNLGPGFERLLRRKERRSAWSPRPGGWSKPRYLDIGTFVFNRGETIIYGPGPSPRPAPGPHGRTEWQPGPDRGPGRPLCADPFRAVTRIALTIREPGQAAPFRNRQGRRPSPWLFLATHPPDYQALWSDRRPK